MDELETFKISLATCNLTEYAAGQGYELDRKESSRSSVVMRHPDGDKIIIARNQSGHICPVSRVIADLHISPLKRLFALPYGPPTQRVDF